MKDKMKIIISGGGTGGHIFPAISIANELKETYPNTEILFIGAAGKMEMERVPKAGYKIIGLPIRGLDRKRPLKNISIIFKLGVSLCKAYRLIKQFKPDVVVGVGGYASGPTLKIASLLKIPTLIQEQNSYAGVTNKLLSKKANKICVAYPEMSKFFPKDKIVLTGNPVRQDLLFNQPTRDEAINSFGFEKNKKCILIIGGSLGAQSINETILEQIDSIIANDEIQFIWQTGKIYYERIKNKLKGYNTIKNLYLTDFITDMNMAYASADLIISRAGASSISEFCLLQKPVILVPSPNVAEDHQTKNALALSERNAAVLIKDSAAKTELLKTAMATVADRNRMSELSKNIYLLARPNATKDIMSEIINIVKEQ